MKKLVFLAMLSGLVFGATIEDARFNTQTNQIELDVKYGGGCGEHLWDLEVGMCLESFPVQCDVKLVHLTDDTCEGLRFETIKFDLAEVGLKNDYYVGASLSIFTVDYGRRSEAKYISLPRSL